MKNNYSRLKDSFISKKINIVMNMKNINFKNKINEFIMRHHTIIKKRN